MQSILNFSTHFTYRKLLRYAVSPVITMIFTSVYTIVDGLFLSNFAGSQAFAAVNFILPYLMLFTSVGFMFGTGGSALIAKTMGEGKPQKANEIFSSLLWVSFAVGFVLTVIGLCCLRPIALWLGAEDALLENSLLYGTIYLFGTPACLIQYEFQNLYITAGKNKLCLYATVASGVLNIVLDALFIGFFHWGITGAACATIISQWLGGIIPFLYFCSRHNNSLLRVVPCKPKGKELLKICINGSSEMVNNISISIVSLLYNVQLLHYAGEHGIAAFGILMYLNFLFTSVFWGFVTAAAPIISFHYGANNRSELHSLSVKCLILVLSCSLLMFVSAELLAYPIADIFVGYDQVLFSMTRHGFLLFSFSFLFSGFSIFASSFFTALSNGFLSAFLSFSRVFLFQIPAVLLLPYCLKLDGIWLSVVVAEFMTCLLGVGLMMKKKKQYGY